MQKPIFRASCHQIQKIFNQQEKGTAWHSSSALHFLKLITTEIKRYSVTEYIKHKRDYTVS